MSMSVSHSSLPPKNHYITNTHNIHRVCLFYHVDTCCSYNVTIERCFRLVCGALMDLIILILQEGLYIYIRERERERES